MAVSNPEKSIQAIERLRALDRVADPALQSLARLAAHLTGAASAGIHILDGDSQHRIAGHDEPLESSPREHSFCRLVVETEEPIITNDVAADGRFSYSPWSTGENRIRYYAGVPLRARAGEVIGTVCVWDTDTIDVPPENEAMLDEISIQVSTHLELTNLVVELGDAASEDPLTGAANRLILNDRLIHHLARVRRHPVRVLVAAIDLDRFKEINDTYGHGAGDQILRATASRLASSLRGEDTVARVGGDEFVVVAEVPSEGPDELDLRRRLNAVVAEPVQFGDGVLWPAATVGVVVAVPGDTPDSVLERADQAMYALKPAGRSRARP